MPGVRGRQFWGRGEHHGGSRGLYDFFGVVDVAVGFAVLCLVDDVVADVVDVAVVVVVVVVGCIYSPTRLSAGIVVHFGRLQE